MGVLPSRQPLLLRRPTVGGEGVAEPEIIKVSQRQNALGAKEGCLGFAERVVAPRAQADAKEDDRPATIDSFEQKAEEGPGRGPH